MADDPNAPVTRFTAVDVVPEPINLASGDFYSFPNLTQEEIDSIPEGSLEPGIVVYNTTYNVYMAYSAHPTDELLNRWTNINTSLTYKGSGFQAGSPFAIPGGSAAEVEADLQNANPGAMYIDLDTDQPRIFTNSWQDLGSGGGGSTFTDITVTDTADINNLQVDGTANFTSGLTAGVIGVTDLVVSGNAAIDFIEAVTTDALLVEGNPFFNGYTHMTGGGSALNMQLGTLNAGVAEGGGFVGTVGADGAHGTGPFTVVVNTADITADYHIDGSLLSGVITLEMSAISASVAPVALLTATFPYDFGGGFYHTPFGVSLTPANEDAGSNLLGIFVTVDPATDAPLVLANFTLSAAILPVGPFPKHYKWNYLIIGNSINAG